MVGRNVSCSHFYDVCILSSEHIRRLYQHKRKKCDQNHCDQRGAEQIGKTRALRAQAYI